MKILKLSGLILILLSCMWIGTSSAIELDGLVTDGKNPIEGARVRVHGQPHFVVTDADGRFHLSTPVDALGPLVITAGKDGWINDGVKISNTTSFTTIVMEKAPEDDDSEYDFITPHKSLVDLRDDPARLVAMRTASHASFKENCNLCHFEPTCYLCHRDIYYQWADSHHAQAVTNPWLQDMYRGTDADGNKNVGPGYRIDFPDQPGNCADCHAPTAALRSPGNTDLAVVYNRGVVAFPTQKGYKTFGQREVERMSGSVDADGIHCDFCHKIKDIEVNDHAGVDGSITMNRVKLIDKEREAEGRLPKMFVYGPYDDVINFSPVSNKAITSPMVASYNPVFSKSEYCSPCHQHRNEHGMPFMDTYSEWKESPYAESGIECQTCHMKPDFNLGRGTFVNGDAEKFWTPIEARDISTVKRHDFIGGDEEMVKNSATLGIEAVADQGVLNIDVNVTNVYAGHHLPTGITIRNMLLLVTPILANGDTLEYIGERKVPEYGGVGSFEEGYYAGYPGKGFALIFGDDEGNYPVMDWQATRIIEDTRIKAKETDVSTYTFALPKNSEKISIHTRLIYRRAFKPLADIKKWKLVDQSVASDITTIEPRLRQVSTR